MKRKFAVATEGTVAGKKIGNLLHLRTWRDESCLP